MGWPLGTHDGRELGDSEGTDVGRAVGQIETLGCIDGCHDVKVSFSCSCGCSPSVAQQEGNFDLPVM